jgi:hypothetical protein
MKEIGNRIRDMVQAYKYIIRNPKRTRACSLKTKDKVKENIFFRPEIALRETGFKM